MSVDPAFAQAGYTLPDAVDERDVQRATRSNEAIAAKIPNLRDASDPNKLTPLRAHYLKKTLVKLQVEKEVAQLSKRDALSTFGPPFKPSPAARNTDLPLSRFIFHHFVLTFPFLRSAPSNFFSDKVQVFMDLFLERNISGSDDREEDTKRRKLTGRLERSVTLLLASALQVGGDTGGEEIVRISDDDRQRMTAAHARMKAAFAGQPFRHEDATFDVNVIGVRNRTTRGRLRNRHHEEFIIRTRRPGQPDVFVSRRYGDFQRLANTLRVEYPDEDISHPPAKDRSTTDMPSSPHQNASALGSEGFDSIEPLDEAAQGMRIDDSRPGSSASGSGSRTRKFSQSGGLPPAGQLAREKNRLTLRAYIRSLLATPPVADSPALADFLIGEPITLTAAEEADCRSRETLDAVRSDEATRFNAEASKRVATLKGHLATFKNDLVQPDGLSRVFRTIRQTPQIEDLPESYRALLAWARISAASTLFHLFMGSDTSSDLFTQLKRIHGLMPYFMMRQILRISNPVAMIRGVIDLFLAQPFGQRSLLQRMFSSSLQEEAKELSEMVTAVKSKVEDDVLSEKVRLFVYAPQDVQAQYRSDAEKEGVDLLTVILRSPEEPRLGRQQIHRVIRASRAYEVYKRYRAGLKNPELEDEGPQDDDAWLYEDLHVLLRITTRLRDKEQMLSLIFEGVTAELLKDMVTIFYSPLAQVYKAANIADSLYDFQVFINDLIKTVEANEELSYTDPQRTVQVFIDLVARHEAKFYTFVHQVHSKGAGLFDGLMHWIELFLNFVRTGDPKDTKQREGQRQGLGSVDLEICLPAGGPERAAALAEIDSLVVHAYRLKMLREMKLSRRIADREIKDAAQSASIGDQGQRAQSGLGLYGGQGGPDDESAFFATMIDNLGFGKGFEADVEEADADAEDEDEESDDDDDDNGEDDDDDDEGRGHSAESKRYDDFVDATSESESESDVSTSGDEGAKAENKPSGSGWRPPPVRGDSVMTITGGLTPVAEKSLPPLPPKTGEPGQGDDESDRRSGDPRRRRQRPLKPQMPTLKVIPEMVPLFVEILRPMLRPARTASANSYRSASSIQPGASRTGSVGGNEGAASEGRGDASSGPVFEAGYQRSSSPTPGGRSANQSPSAQQQPQGWAAWASSFVGGGGGGGSGSGPSSNAPPSPAPGYNYESRVHRRGGSR